MSNVLPNVIKYLGYVLAFAGVLLSFGVSATMILAGGALAGLIVGLTLRPMLEDFFAGILIIATRFVTVGNHIRLTSTQIPYSPAVLPLASTFRGTTLSLAGFGTVLLYLYFIRCISVRPTESTTT